MVQKLPDNRDEVILMINEYIEENDIVRNSFSNDVDHVYLHFYIPSIIFPVYFEEDKNPFVLDDYIGGYSENMFILVVFDDIDSEGEYLFYD